MPIIDICFPQGALSDEAKQALPNVLGQIALGYEGLKGSQFAEEFTWVYVYELPKASVTQVSGPLAKPIYRVRFTTLQNLLDDNSKKRLGVDTARAIYEAEGTPWNSGEAHNRVWTFFEDIRQGDWIVGDQVNSIQDLRAAFAEEQASLAEEKVA